MPLNERAPPAATERGSKSKLSVTKYTSANPRTSIDSADFEIEEGTRVFVPPGTYNVAFVSWWTGLMFGKAKKLGLIFKITDFGEHFGKQVMRWYNIRRFIGHTGKHGRFQAMKGSDFIRDYVRLFGMPTRTDRASLTKYERILIKAQIVTVNLNSSQSDILEPLQYSVIRQLNAIEAGTADQSEAT